MLQRLSERVADCYRHARDARESAERAPEAEKLDYFAIEQRWLMLAESYELVERIGAFTSESTKRAAAFLPEDPPATTSRVTCPSCGNAMRPTNTGQAPSEPGANRFYFACRACDVTVLRAGRTD